MEKQKLFPHVTGTSDFFELRCYHIAAGRMPDMLNRLQNDLLPLFQKHGILMECAWESQTSEGIPLFAYLVKYSSYDARTSSWNAFYSDPQWHEARARTNAGSDLVTRTDLYPLRAHVWTESAVEARHLDLLLVSVPIGKTTDVVEELRATTPDSLAEHEGACAFVFEHLFGVGLPALMVAVRSGPNETALNLDAIIKNASVTQALRMRKITASRTVRS